MARFEQGQKPALPATIGGQLLVATPVLRDGVFDDTVVYVLAHGDDGTIGVVLNQPTNLAVGDAISSWGDLATAPAVLFDGGPVEETTLVGLASTEAGGEGFARVPGALQCWTMDLGLDAALAATHVTSLRLFAGYAGWGPGQLEGEILAGAWFVADAIYPDVFSAEPDDLWQRVLSRQPDSRRWFVHYPDDPQAN